MIIQGKEIQAWCPKCDVEVYGHTSYATINGSIHCDNCKTEVVKKEWLDKQRKKLSYKLRKLWERF